eukprot:Seg1540.2 transcript_id=Seg1540.2/GoldUCD/mRNA.D3Y31 product="hypothetical protein" protein_id=Seg1540.2/GoldUCD/D3Y31
MVQKWPNETDMQGEQDKDKKAGNRFLYQNKRNKANPWSSFENDLQDDSSANFGKKPLRNSILNEQKAATDSLAVSRKSKFDLESVWSVKNVPLPSNKSQPSQINLQTGNSYYSRHAGAMIGSHHNKTDGKANSDKSSDNGSWNLKRPGYSYTSNQGSLKRQASDDDDEFDFGGTKKGNFRNDHQSPSHTTSQGRIPQQDQASTKGSLAGVMNNNMRKGSARTQRAQKMHEAYLRSAGLGQYTPFNPFNSNDEGDID